MPVLLAKKYSKPIQSVEEEIRRRLQAEEADTFIYVVPTKRKLRELQRELLHVVPAKTSLAFHLFTLETLAMKLYSTFCAPAQVVSGPSQAVLMHNAFELARKDLRYFVVSSERRTLPKGTFQKIIDVINNLKEAGVYPSALYEELGSAEVGEQPKLQDILTIYRHYESVLGDRFIDLGGIYKDLNFRWQPETAAALFRETFPRVDVIFAAGFDEFSDPEITMLEHLAQLGGLAMMIPFDYHPENDALFGHLRENYQKFSDLRYGLIGRSLPEKTPAGREGFREHVSRNLFRRDGHAAVDCKNRVTLFRAADRHEEVVLIAKLVKCLVQKSPERDLSKICVAMYQPQVYTNLFREVFSRYGIPANITDRFALDQSPLVVAILSLLHVWNNNFRQRDILRALSSPYFDFTKSGDTIDAGNLYEVSARLKITVGKRQWRRRIALRLAQIADLLREADDEVQEEELRREERRLHKALADIERLTSLLRPFDARLTPIQFKSRLVELLDELKVSARLLGLYGSVTEEQLETDTRALQRFQRFLDEFLTILSLREQQGLGDGVAAPLSFYLEELRIAISHVRYNIRQKYGYGVYVTSLEETRGLQFDVMFVAGLVDGEFPPAYDPDIFLSETRRQKKELYHLVEHRYLFYQGVTNFTEHLYLSYPGKDGDLELVPSSFLDAFLTIVRTETWLEELPQELLLPVYSEEELLQRMGKNVGAAMAAGQKVELGNLLDRYGFREIAEHLLHTITVEYSRTVTHALPEYEGTVYGKLSDEARRKLEAFKNKVFSVSRLESYGKCPFQYFSSRVLRLNVLPEMEEGLTPLEKGGVIHEILYEFYVDRREKNLPPLFECSAAQFDQALHDLKAVARAKLKALNIPDVLWRIDKELLLGGHGRKGALESFLEKEACRKLNVVPKYFEVAFGPYVGGRRASDPRLGDKNPITAGNVQLRGKVDRIEVGEDIFTVIDYKTGEHTPRREEIDLGMSLQLPMYLYAVERLLAEHSRQSLKPAAGIYYKLIPAKEELGLGNAEFSGKAFPLARKSKQLMENGKALRALVDQAILFVNEYVDDIGHGKFPLTTPEKAERVCRYCDFQRVCRIQTQIPTILESV